MSKCGNCPQLDFDGPKRARCCGESIDEAVARITELGRDAPALACWAPGDYDCICAGCGAIFTGDKRAVACLPCAIRATDNPRTEPLTPAEQAQIDAILARMQRRPGTATADQSRATIDAAAPIGPKVGQGIKFPGADGRTMRGVVCAPDDPHRSGTFRSNRYGDIPVKIDHRNRKARRAAQSRAR